MPDVELKGVKYTDDASQRQSGAGYQNTQFNGTSPVETTDVKHDSNRSDSGDYVVMSGGDQNGVDNLGHENLGFEKDAIRDLSGSCTENIEQPREAFQNTRDQGYSAQTNSPDEIDVKIQDDEVEEEPNACMKRIKTIQTGVYGWFARHKKTVIRAILVILLLLYIAYFIYAMYYYFGGHLDEKYGDEGSIRLLWITCAVVFFVVVSLLWKHLHMSKHLKPCTEKVSLHGNQISWILAACLYLAVAIFIIIDVVSISKEPYNLVSLSGMVFYVLLFFIFSSSPAHVNWRAVVWGLGLQLILALIILRWTWGYEAFKWLGDRVAEFLAHTDAGSAFVFGYDTFEHHFFAFKILPVVVFFSTVISILYYLGVMQFVIRKLASVMQVCMRTTAAESLNAAANIFIGQSEAPLMIRPLIKDLTKSELHAIMTGGFATIAGAVMATYIMFGVPANHLISASVMSAPAALAMAKLFYPETEISKTTAKNVCIMEKSPERNIIEAASSGASQSIKLVANIAANLIAFLALLAFLNATLTWFGNRVGVEELTFELICSYVLWPLSLLMGVDVADCRKVATLLGVKTFLNEFVAYERLSIFLQNRQVLDEYVASNGTWDYQGEDIFLIDANSTLIGGVMTERSEVISTYALCGFANVGSMGIMLGSLGAMAPDRKGDMSKVVLRAMLAGNVACFMTACIAGLFYQGEL